MLGEINNLNKKPGITGIIGCFMGGAIIQKIIEKYQDKVKAEVLLSSAARYCEEHKELDAK